MHSPGPGLLFGVVEVDPVYFLHSPGDAGAAAQGPYFENHTSASIPSVAKEFKSETCQSHAAN